MSKVNFDIIAHRGYWKTKSEQNTMASFERALTKGYGIETDLRDAKQRIVIAHDAFPDQAPTFEQFCELYKKLDSDCPLALNIKADGLLVKLKEVLAAYAIDNFFIFDMSIPETLKTVKTGLKFYSRISEYEPVDVFADHSAGIWFDSFQGQMALTEKYLLEHKNKPFCVVSPELHSRDDYKKQWAALKMLDSRRIQICTDFPDLAKEFFHGSN